GMSTLQSSLKYHAPQATEPLLNRSIRNENEIESIVVLDAAGNLFARNSISPSGLYINEPVHRTGNPSVIREEKVVHPKHGEILFTHYERGCFAISKTILDGTMVLGTIKEEIDSGTLFKDLILNHRLSGELEINPFNSAKSKNC